MRRKHELDGQLEQWAQPRGDVLARHAGTQPALVDLEALAEVEGWALSARCADTLRPVSVSTDEARSLALSLPEAVELDHHGRPSFRVGGGGGGKIFATIWNEQRMNVMLDDGGIRTAVEGAPEACEEVWWGKRLTAVGVTLALIDRDLLTDLLADAWEHKAPKRLLGA